MSERGTLEEKCINTIRFLAADAIEKAKSGHPGMPMGAAAAAFTLWTRRLKHNPADPLWPDRDRFVLSAGHASMLLYTLLYLSGYDLSLDDLKAFRQWGSKTPGHPERRHPAGAEMTTGPLGQGLAAAVGMAIAEAHLAARFNRPGHPVVDHRTYVFASDGDLMEGLSAEACALAGHLGLGKLTLLYDDNRISLSGATSLCFTEDIDQRFAAIRLAGDRRSGRKRHGGGRPGARPGGGGDRETLAHPSPDDDRLRGAQEAEFQCGARLAARGGGAQGGQGEPRLAGRSPVLRSGGGAWFLPAGRGRKREETGILEGGLPELRRRISGGGRRIRTGHERASSRPAGRRRCPSTVRGRRTWRRARRPRPSSRPSGRRFRN